MALWSDASALDRKIEGSKLAANFSFKWTTKTRKKRGDEFGSETKKRKRRARERPWTRKRARNHQIVSLDPKLLSVNGKESIQRMWSERPLRRVKHSKDMKQERTSNEHVGGTDGSVKC